MRNKPKQSPSFLFPACQTQAKTHWRPSVDVYRLRNGWLLKYDLAGVLLEDVSVEVEGCRITVSGIRRDYLAEKAEACFSMEIAYNRFERTVELPCAFAEPHVTVSASNGILVIHVTEG